jgi:hypothetical protein
LDAAGGGRSGLITRARSANLYLHSMPNTHSFPFISYLTRLHFPVGKPGERGGDARPASRRHLCKSVSTDVVARQSRAIITYTVPACA